MLEFLVKYLINVCVKTQIDLMEEHTWHLLSLSFFACSFISEFQGKQNVEKKSDHVPEVRDKQLQHSVWWSILEYNIAQLAIYHISNLTF